MRPPAENLRETDGRRPRTSLSRLTNSISLPIGTKVGPVVSQGFTYIRATFTMPRSPTPTKGPCAFDEMMKGSKKLSQAAHLPNKYASSASSKELQYPQRLFNELVDGFAKAEVGVEARDVPHLRTLILALRDALQISTGESF